MVTSVDCRLPLGDTRRHRMGLEKLHLYKALMGCWCTARADNPFSSHSNTFMNQCYHLDLASSCALNLDVMCKAGNEVHLSMYSTNVLNTYHVPGTWLGVGESRGE